MEKKKPLNLKRLTLEITAIILATAIAAFAVSQTIHMTAPAAAGSAAFYSDAGATVLITTPWDWSLHGVTGLHNGDSLLVYLKNTGSTDLSANITILNPSCVITSNPNYLIPLPVGAIQAVNLTFSGIVGGSTISWDLKADY